MWTTSNSSGELSSVSSVGQVVAAACLEVKFSFDLLYLIDHSTNA